MKKSAVSRERERGFSNRYSCPKEILDRTRHKGMEHTEDCGRVANDNKLDKDVPQTLH